MPELTLDNLIVFFSNFDSGAKIVVTLDAASNGHKYVQATVQYLIHEVGRDSLPAVK